MIEPRLAELVTLSKTQPGAERPPTGFQTISPMEHARIGGYHPLVNIMSTLSYSYFERAGQAAYSGNVGLCMFPFANTVVIGFAWAVDLPCTMRPTPGFDDPEPEYQDG
jgi:hypothetical protein